MSLYGYFVLAGKETAYEKLQVSPASDTAQTGLVPSRGSSSSQARSDSDALGCVQSSSLKRGADASQEDGRSSKKPRILTRLKNVGLDNGLWVFTRSSLAMGFAQGVCLRSIVATLSGTTVTFWYIDPCGMVVSNAGLCLLSNFTDFVAATVAIECLKTSGWEVIPRLILPEGMSKNDLLLAGTLRGCAFDVPRDSAADCMHHRVTFGECTYSRAALVGRRTVVYAAQAHPPFAGQKPAERIVAKLSYQSTARTAEYELIERARRAGVPHIPTVHGYHDLFDFESLQDGIRARIVEHCGVFDSYENRVARVLVSRMYTPLLQRLHKQPWDLVRMVDQISECMLPSSSVVAISLTAQFTALHCLRYDAKILHRDVSVRNIMCEETEKGPNFILGDFRYFSLPFYSLMFPITSETSD